MSLRPWAGRPKVEEIAELGRTLFKHVIAGRLHTEVWRLREARRAMGHTIVVVSSATRFQVEPMAAELGTDHALCTPVEVRDGQLTGHRDGPTLWGEGKARAVRVAFIDPENRTNASEALEPAVAKIREEGMSIVIAPEGTRSATPRLGRFKKGAFHIALQAGVPVVPIVIRNAGEVMWRGSQTLRAGTVEVIVLPPVETDKWSVGTMDAHATEGGGMFLEKLATWPGSQPPTADPSPTATVAAAAP